jgi:hypothetical protein
VENNFSRATFTSVIYNFSKSFYQLACLKHIYRYSNDKKGIKSNAATLGSILLLLPIVATVTTPLLIYHFERGRIPKSAFEKPYRKNRENQTNNVVFFIGIRNVNNYTDGRAEFCSGLIELIGTPIKNMPTIWVENSQEDFSFADYANLRLFTAKEGEQINFYNKQRYLDAKPYSVCIHKEIKINLEIQRGRCPAPLTGRIEDIISNAQEETYD